MHELEEHDHLALQAVVHRVARAVAAAVPTERMYALSLGSAQGNAHLHWHVAPLPPGCRTSGSSTARSWPSTASSRSTSPSRPRSLPKSGHISPASVGRSGSHLDAGHGAAAIEEAWAEVPSDEDEDFWAAFDARLWPRLRDRDSGIR